MRVLHCIPALNAGGSERQLALLSRVLPRHGWDVHVAALDGGDFENAFDPATTLHRIASSHKYDPRIPLRIGALIDRLRPAIVQTWLLKMDILGGLAALATGVPWVATERSSPLGYPPHWTIPLRSLLVRRAHALVANSAGGLALWQPAPPRQMQRIIRNGVEAIEVDPQLPDGIDVDAVTPVIACSGRLVPEKRLDTFLQALARVRRDVKATAILCGTGPFESELRSMARGLGIEDSVIFAGFVDDVHAVNVRADVFVSLSRVEGSPNAVQEAMACGTPVVVSDIAAHREVADERSARIVDGDDAHAIAAAIVDCIRDHDAAKARAANARALVTAWHPEAMAAEYDTVYREVLQARSRVAVPVRPLAHRLD